MKPNPKTAKDLKNNEQILKALDANHQDNLFKPNLNSKKGATSKSKKDKDEIISQQPPRASDILGELFDSDSEQNISLHSSRTPITAFLNRMKSQNDDEEVSEKDDQKENQEIGRDNGEPAFQEHAFLARKAKEAKKVSSSHKLMKTFQQSPLMISSNDKRKRKRIEKDTNAISRYSQEVST